MITFSCEPIPDTLIFEEAYPENLALDLETRRKILSCGVALYVYVRGKLAGEHYGNTPANIFQKTGEHIPDTDIHDVDSYYAYSTTILPKFRGEGLSTKLLIYAQGYLTGMYPKIIGHATSEAMFHIRVDLGAHMVKKHRNWYNTGRLAWYYEQDL